MALLCGVWELYFRMYFELFKDCPKLPNCAELPEYPLNPPKIVELLLTVWRPKQSKTNPNVEELIDTLCMQLMYFIFITH